MPGATMSVEATFVASNSVLVQWTAVPDTACDKINYTITYHNVTNQCSNVITVYTTGTSILLSGLTGGATYTITVTATNSVGMGPSSEGILYTVTRSPSTPPTHFDISGEIYKISCINVTTKGSFIGMGAVWYINCQVLKMSASHVS